MKIEKRTTLESNNSDSLSNALRNLKESESLRLTTAREGRNVASVAFRIAKERKIKFKWVAAGDDILVSIEK